MANDFESKLRELEKELQKEVQKDLDNNFHDSIKNLQNDLESAVKIEDTFNDNVRALENDLQSAVPKDDSIFTYSSDSVPSVDDTYSDVGGSNDYSPEIPSSSDASGDTVGSSESSSSSSDNSGTGSATESAPSDSQVPSSESAPGSAVPSENVDAGAPGAPGYNPNVDSQNNGEVPNANSLPKEDGLNKNDNNENGNNSLDNANNGENQANNSNQDSNDANNTPGNGVPNGENNEGSKMDMPEKENPVDNTLPDQNPNGGDKTSGLDKKDGLEDNQNKNAEGDKKPETAATQKANDTKGTAPAGNGYGALKNKNNSNADPTARARQQKEHNDKSGTGSQNAAKKVDSTKKTPLKNGLSGLSNFGNDFKNKIKSKFMPKGGEETTSRGIKPGQEIKAKIAKALNLLKKNPYLFLIAAVVFIVLFAVVVDEIENTSRKGGAHCTYDLKGVTTSGSVKLEGLQVELVNCDATAGNYTVLETVDFEKYVLGVALAEIGPSAADEALKSQIIAARGFSLTRNSGMCPSNPDNCFYGYNASTGKIRMRACENDQVYWDYEKDIYRYDRGSVSLYSPEINSGTVWKHALSEERKAQVLALAEDVKGKVLVDTNGNAVSTNYVASVTDQFTAKAAEGKTYDQILNEVYADKNADGFSSGHCTSYGNIDYGDYVLSSDGHEILHTRLDSFLQSNGTSLEEFSGLIASNVDKAGYGTRAGVVAAAVTLIAELGNNYNVKVPYYWGGGHYDGIVDGALGYWGSTECHTYANGQHYNYCGFDCSGFVPWAIKNGGFNIPHMLAGNFKNLSGAQRVSLSGSTAVLQPGDLLESSGHIVLVVGIEESTKQYICAEAAGNASGVLFTRRPFGGNSGYWGVKMDSYYENNARSK